MPTPFHNIDIHCQRIINCVVAEQNFGSGGAIMEIGELGWAHGNIQILYLRRLKRKICMKID